MPKLPRISSKEAIRALERLGFYQVRVFQVKKCSICRVG